MAAFRAEIPLARRYFPSQRANAPGHIMTRVCIIGKEEIDLQAELLSRETSREALSSYQLSRPYQNTLTVETISIGSAVSMLNDLNWYLVRFARDALVLEPSVSDTEWLSRKLATEIRDNDIEPEETGHFLKIYGVADDRLVEPMYTQRVTDATPSYDLQEVEETLLVRVMEAEFGG